MRLYVLLCALTLVGCNAKPPVSQTIANCEQQAYARLGVQSDENSTPEYAMSKYELVRVCAVSAGLRFRAKEWSPYPLIIQERVYRQYEIWTELPRSEKYQQRIQLAMNEHDKQMALAMIRAEFWE